MALKVRLGGGQVKVQEVVQYDLPEYARILDGILALRMTAANKVPLFKSRPLELTAIERRPSEHGSVLVCFGAQNQWHIRCWNRQVLQMSHRSLVQLLKNRHHVIYQFDEKIDGKMVTRTVIVIVNSKGCYSIVAEARPKTDTE